MDKRVHVARGVVVAAGMLCLASNISAQVVISEFMAANETALTDSNGDPSDWLELYNPSSQPVSLVGHFLTDDAGEPEKWPIPDLELAAGEFLIIFASGKDRRDPERQLHTNFKLARSGEFIALVGPAGQLVSHFGTEYPPQVTDSSYGVGMQLRETVLVDEGATVRFIDPRTTDLQEGWDLPGFDDATWSSGAMPIGFDQNETPVFQDLIQTDIRDVVGQDSSTLFVRTTFDLADPVDVKRVELRIRYDDGFAAQLNGNSLVSDNTSRVVRITSTAVRKRAPEDVRTVSTFRATVPPDVLVPGENVLTIQLLNDRRTDPEMFLSATLVVVDVDSVDAAETGYFDPATPAWPGGQPLPSVSAPPALEQPAGFYPAPFDAVITKTDPAAEIRYTLDGSRPHATSTLYTGPFRIENNAVLTARAFSPGRIPSESVVAQYSVLGAELQTFSSNLPIFVITMRGQPTPNWSDMRIDLFEPLDGDRSELSAETTFSGVGDIKVRGSSTEGRPKKGFTVEIQDEDGDDLRVPLLGMPADSDWVLYAAYNFDHARMRNAYIYQLGRELAEDVGKNPGSYAVRTRFCEVFVSFYGQPLSEANYVGLYSFMEKIKQGPGRVDVAELDPDATEEPEITGGYIVKIDRADPGDTGFSAGGQTLRYVEPKEEEIRERPEQAGWLRDFFNRMAGSLANTGTEPIEKITEYIDVQSWIDHSWLNILAMNVDAYRLSGYMHIDRGGKLAMGPIWDFDRSTGSTDGRDANPLQWKGTGDGTDYFNYPWWRNLHRNDAYIRLWEARWRQLRKSIFSTEHIDGLIDSMAAETAEAWERDHARWNNGSTQQAAVDRIKSWLRLRAEWIDGQTTPRPEVNPDDGVVTPGLEISLGIEGGADLFYTINGSDPLISLEEGPAPEAILHSGESIVVDEPITVRARGRLAGVWSTLIEKVYTPRSLPLAITEIMFDPPLTEQSNFSRTRYEFIEMQNIGRETVDLSSIHFTDPRFSFADASKKTLAPGGFLVIVNDVAAFEERYGTEGIQVAGEFAGSLSNLRDDIIALNALEQPVIRFQYIGSWQPLAREGHSLVLQDPTAPVEAMGLEESWVPSAEVMGSPGRADGASVSTSGRRIVADLNSDGRLNIVDVLGLIEHIFRNPQPLPCESPEANRVLLDFDGDGSVSIVDPIRALGFLFRDEAPPALGVGCRPVAGCTERCGDA